MKKRMIAMLLAGGQGSRLGVLTAKVAKPAVSFGGKYKIIDFPLSNCVNSGVNTVGVLTQYRPLRLNSHIGIGIPWDLDRKDGGVFVLPPYEKSGEGEWYSGTANAIYQNIEFMDAYNPQYVLILSGDHIYKMDYEDMLEHHIKAGAEVTIASMPVPWEEASRFGIVIADKNHKITGFEEKPAKPKSNLASMGIYIFNYELLRKELIKLKKVANCDFGKHVIPDCFKQKLPMTTYEFKDYWKDVGTLSSYWDANMGLLKASPELNLYEQLEKIYTRTDSLPAAYMGANAEVKSSMIGRASQIYGSLDKCVLGCGVTIGEGSELSECIVMQGVTIGKNVRASKAIIGDNSQIGDNVVIGAGEYAESVYDKRVYCSELVIIDENTVIPSGVSIGKNTAISGVTKKKDYPGGALTSGGAIIKEEK